MMNVAHLATSRQSFRVELKRKPTCNAHQNSMRHVVEVKAQDKYEAEAITLAMPQNAAYQVKSVREIR